MDQLPFNHIGFQAHLQEERLVGSRCTSCSTLFVPPHMLCTHCFDTQMEWQPFSGEGRLVGFTAIHVGLPAMVAEGYSLDHPYYSGVVQLVEGPAISGQLVGFESASPESIQVGTPVRAVFLQRGSGTEQRTYLAFAPLDRAG